MTATQDEIAASFDHPSSAAMNEMPDFSDVVLAIYGSLNQAIPWEHCLESLRGYMQASCTALALRPPSSDDLGFMAISEARARDQVRQPELTDMAREYQSELYRLNPFVDLPPELVTTPEEAVGLQQWRSCRFYKEVLERNGLLHVLGVNIPTSAGTDCRLRIFRSGDEGPFSNLSRERLARLVPHFKQALNLYASLDRHECERELYLATLGRMHIATFVLDESSRVISTNASAEHLISLNDGIRRVEHRLEASDGGGTVEIDRALRMAAANPSAVFGTSLTRPSGKRSLSLVVHRLPLRPKSEGRGRAAWAVFARDPDEPNDMDTRVIQQLFGLTPSEALLAVQLMNGHSIDDAAQNLEISRNTARAQLRSIFTKTGVSRQTELVHALMNGMAELTNPAPHFTTDLDVPEVGDGKAVIPT